MPFYVPYYGIYFGFITPSLFNTYKILSASAASGREFLKIEATKNFCIPFVKGLTTPSIARMVVVYLTRGRLGEVIQHWMMMKD